MTISEAYRALGPPPWHGEVMLPNASNDHVSPGVRWDIQPVSFMRNYQSFQRNTIKSPDFKSCWCFNDPTLPLTNGRFKCILRNLAIWHWSRLVVYSIIPFELMQDFFHQQYGQVVHHFCTLRWPSKSKIIPDIRTHPVDSWVTTSLPDQCQLWFNTIKCWGCIIVGGQDSKRSIHIGHLSEGLKWQPEIMSSRWYSQRPTKLQIQTKAVL